MTQSQGLIYEICKHRSVSKSHLYPWNCLVWKVIKGLDHLKFRLFLWCRRYLVPCYLIVVPSRKQIILDATDGTWGDLIIFQTMVKWLKTPPRFHLALYHKITKAKSLINCNVPPLTSDYCNAIFTPMIVGWNTPLFSLFNLWESI